MTSNVRLTHSSILELLRLVDSVVEVRCPELLMAPNYIAYQFVETPSAE